MPGSRWFDSSRDLLFHPTKHVGGYLNTPFFKGSRFHHHHHHPKFWSRKIAELPGTTFNLSGVPILASHTLPCRTSRSVAHQHSYIHGDEWTSISWKNHTESWTSKAEMCCVSILYQSTRSFSSTCIYFWAFSHRSFFAKAVFISYQVMPTTCFYLLSQNTTRGPGKILGYTILFASSCSRLKTNSNPT